MPSSSQSVGELGGRKILPAPPIGLRDNVGIVPYEQNRSTYF